MNPNGTLPRRRPALLALSCLLALGVAACDRGTSSTDPIGGTVNRDDSARALPARTTREDLALGAQVRSALHSIPGLKALEIEVDAADGAVTLYGTADTPSRRDEAARVALNVDGVKSVTNHLILLKDS
jgi:hypothetical protein